MSESRGHAVVENAADPRQVKAGARRGRRQEDERGTVVGQQMATPAGRQFVFLELMRCGVYDIVDGPMELVYAENAKRVHARQLDAELRAHHPGAYRLMLTEAEGRQKRTQAEIDALHTPRAGDN